MRTTTLKPGLLVGFSTSMLGNVKYSKENLQADHLTAEGTRLAEWKTERVIEDPAEFENAQKSRGRANTIIRSVCSKSAFGLLCPESRSDQLEAAMAEARKVVEDFNSSAQLTKLKVYIIVGRIAADDVEAVRAINSEVRELLADMERGVKNLDVDMIRDAASRAVGIGKMLTPEAAARIQTAIEAARSTARKIAKAGEGAAQEVDSLTLAKLDFAKQTFVDLEEGEQITLPLEAGRAVDLMGDDEPLTGFAQVSTTAAVE